MKKIIALALMLVVVITSFAACSSKFKCDSCGQKKSGTKHSVELFGEKATICDDCNKGMEAIGELGDLDLGDL